MPQAHLMEGLAKTHALDRDHLAEQLDTKTQVCPALPSPAPRLS